MATFHSSWLHQGFFVLGKDGLMPSVRTDLENLLNLRRGSLHISSFPVGPNWTHTYWWREGDVRYAEAQFFAQIAKEYPVLSLGVAIEKGWEVPQAVTDPPHLMDRRKWDWPRIVKYHQALLSEDVPQCAKLLQRPVHLRITVKSVQDSAWQSRAFSFFENTWFERYVGQVSSETIGDYIKGVDSRKDSWAIVHFADDVCPEEAEGKTPLQAATNLMAFNSLRQRLRGSPINPAAAHRRIVTA